MTRNEINHYVKSAAEDLWKKQYSGHDDAAIKFQLGITVIIPIVVGLNSGLLLGIGTFLGLILLLLQVMDFTYALRYQAYAKELDAQARVLEAVSRLRGTDDPN